MSKKLSRRNALKRLATAAGVLVAVPAVRAAADKPHVTPKDPTAMALSYFEDAKMVDAKKFPTYKPGQQCSNCLQVAAPTTGTWLGCSLFPGKLVHSDGWCKVWIKKP